MYICNIYIIYIYIYIGWYSSLVIPPLVVFSVHFFASLFVLFVSHAFSASSLFLLQVLFAFLRT